MRRLAGLLLAAAVAAGLFRPPAALPVPLRLASGVAALVLLCCAAARMAGHLAAGQPRAVRATAAGVLAVVLWTLPAAVAGNAGALTPYLLRPLALSLFLLTRLLPPRGPEGPGGPGGPPLSRAERAVFAAAGAAAALLVGGAVWAQRLAPPGTNAYDDTSYHLSAVATWRAFGDLRTIVFPVGDASPAFYPLASELTSFALLSAADPSDVLARWTELPFALLTLVAVAAIAGKLGASRGGQLLAVLAFASVPRAFPQLALSAGNDNAVAFLTCASALALLVLAESPSLPAGLLAGAALGLLAGTKYTGLLFAGACAPLLLIALTSPARPGGPRRVSLLLAIGGAALLAGGWTYVRNAVAAGNPLFPLPLPGLPGWADAARSGWASRPEAAIDPWRFLLARPDRTGALFPFLLLPAALLAPVAALLHRGRPARERARDVAVLALPVLLYLEFLFLMIDHRDVRYILAAFALAAIALATLVERSGRVAPALRLAVAAAFLAAALSRFIGGAPGAPPAWAIVVIVAAAGAAAASVPGVPRLVQRKGLAGAAPLAGAAAVVLLGLASARWVAAYQEARLAPGSLARLLDARTATEGATVAVAGTNQPYLLSGGRLQNRVVYVRTQGPPPLSFFDWRRPAPVPGERPRLSAWLANLGRSGARFLAVRYDEPTPEHEWTDLVPDAIRLVARGTDGDLFELLPDRLASVRPVEATFDESLPVALDEPAEGQLLHDVLRARGWCQERGGGRIEPRVFRVDGRPIPVLTLKRTPRPDVAAAIPAIGDGSAAGWEATLSSAGLAPGEHRLVVVFATPDGRWRRSPVRRFATSP